ncbi:MAG: hypothetical protein ACTHOM_04815 [Allomuricauda sp.]
MKQTILICLVICQVSYSQWTYKKGGNKFDGEYKTASVIGKGGEWPYTKPTFVINKFGGEEPNFYLTRIGYTGCSNPTISFAFDGSDDIIRFKASSDKENEAAFIIGLSFEIQELLELLKSKSKVYVRYEDNCNKNDYEFGLSGSTNAINYVVGNYYEEYTAKLEKEIERERKRKEEQRKVDSIRNEIRKQEIVERKRMDSIQAVKNKIKIEKESESFQKELLNAFNFKGLEVNARPLKILFSFTPKKTVKATYCKKIYPYPSNTVIVDKEQNFYKSETIEVLNRFDEGCLRCDIRDKSGELQHTYYFNLSELLKLSDDYRIQVLNLEWLNIQRLHDRGI